MRLALLCVLSSLSMSVIADELTIDRLFSDPALLGPTPRGLKIAPDGTRVTFLRGKADDQNQLDLWEYNLAEGRTRLLVDSRALQPEARALSDAELAQRERMRIAGLKGIVSYRWAPDGQRLLFPLDQRLYLYDLARPAAGAVRALTPAGTETTDAQVSPGGRWVSYVAGQNLWVIDLAKDKPRALTRDGGGTVHNGEAEFVAQEEMDRFAGYWWSPDDRYLAFERYDEARVPEVERFEIRADGTSVSRQRYPAAGQPNVRVQLGLVSPQGGKPRWIDLGKDDDIYLVRVAWSADGHELVYQRMDRRQQRLDLVAVDAASLRQRTLLTETSDTWVALHDDLRFLAAGDGFVWASEKSGHKHLYLHDRDGRERHALTAGDWDVDKLLAIDEVAGLVYFAANKDHPLDKQIYAARLDGSDAASPSRLTTEDGWHEATFPDTQGKAVKLLVDQWSDPVTPTQVSVRAPDGRRLAFIEENRLDESHPYGPYHLGHVRPEFGTLSAEDGQTLWYRLYKPAGFDPAKRYPVISHFYGGPHAQLAKRDFGDLFDQYLARHGYVVVTLDNRGMARRGKRFAAAIHRELGRVEVADQRRLIEWLGTQPWVDAKRIGVFGWSYGGYLSLMMLAKASDVVAAGVAVAPVTDWTLYDTFYTERYLSTPALNPDGYTRSGVLHWLDGLGSPLLLVHGMADDNVLFTNSTQLMAALQARGTPFDLMTYPGGKHGLSTPAMKKHVFHAIVRWFDGKLKPDVPLAAH